MKSLQLGTNLTFPLSLARERIAIFGQSGSGKTNLLYLLFEVMVRSGVQVGLVDPPGVGWGLAYNRKGEPNDLPVTILGGRRADLPIVAGRARELADVVIDQQLSFVLDLTEFENDKVQATWLAEFIARIHRRKIEKPGLLHLMFDEGQDAAPSKPRTSEQSELGGIVERFCKQIRNYGVGWTVASQQPQAVDSRIRGQTSCVFAMRTRGELDIKAVISTVNRRTGGLSPKQLEHLATGHALVYSPMFFGDGEIIEHEIGYRSTFDVPKAAEERTAMPVARARLSAGELAKLKGAYGDAVQEAERTDPAALQRKVEELQRELDQVRAGKPSTSTPAPPKIVHVEVPALKPGELDRAHKLVDQLLQAGGEATAAAKVVSDALRLVGAPTKHPSVLIKPDRVDAAPRAAPAPRPMPAGDSKVSSGGRKLLVSLATTLKASLTWDEVAVIAGFKQSGSFRNLKSELRTGGFIEERGDQVLITEAGLEAIGGRPPAMSGPEMRSTWLGKAGGATARMLEYLFGIFPDRTTRDELAAAAGVVQSGSYRNNLSWLRSRGLLEESGEQLRASALLFPEHQERAHG